MKYYLLLLIAILPLSALAEPLRYGSISAMTPAGFMATHGTLEEQSAYDCSVAALSCRDLGREYAPAVPERFAGAYVSYDGTASHALVSHGGRDAAIYAITPLGWQEQAPLSFSVIPDRTYWSGDGSRVLLVSGATTFSYDARTGKLVNARQYRPSGAFLTVSSTGRYIASFSAARSGNGHTRTYSLYDMEAGKRYATTSTSTYWDLISEETAVFSFAPDDSGLYYLDDRGGYPTLYHADLPLSSDKDLRGRALTAKRYSVGPFLYADANTLYFVANRDNPLLWRLYEYDLATHGLSAVADDVSYAYRLRQVPGGIVFFQIRNNSSVPVFYDRASGEVKEFAGLEGNTEAAAVERKTVSFSGLTAAMVTGKPSSGAPLLIWLHGGPFRQTSAGYHPYRSYAVYDWMLDEAAQSGAVVMKLDYRGSYGYGRSFSESIRRNVGKGDVADVAQAIAYARKNYDVGDIYVVGNSYGGYLALRSLVGYPKTIAGAVSINGVTDWKTLLANLQTSIFNVHFDGAPGGRNAGLYSQASIFERLHRLSAEDRVLLFQSQEDRTIPSSQADLLVEEMLERGKQVELVPYPGENHVFAKASSVQDMCVRLLRFIRTDGGGRCAFE